MADAPGLKARAQAGWGVMRLIGIPIAIAAGAALGAGCSSSLLPQDLAPMHDSDFRLERAYANADPKAKIELGRLLFFDKILSGNKNISCATCHHPAHGTTDGRALPIGEGGIGLGPKRRVHPRHPVLGHVPRNSPALYFVGAKSIRNMFHDGRIAVDTTGKFKSGFLSPAGAVLPKGLESLAAVQAMFPVTSDREMAGQKGENKIANLSAAEKPGWQAKVWNILAKRLREIPGYVELFKKAFPDVTQPADITYVHAANAIGAFEAQAFRADNSPFDQYLRSRDRNVLTPAAARGMDLFYGRARCSTCHSGPLMTDQKFHAIAMPQIGPGKGHGEDKSFAAKTGLKFYLEDEGRYAITHQKADLFKFRTPSLRNVELTAPYGHAGGYKTLEAVIRHHTDPVRWLKAYNVASLRPPPLKAAVFQTEGKRPRVTRLRGRKLKAFQSGDIWVQSNPALRDRIGEAASLQKVELTDGEIQNLVAFLKALTDPKSRNQLYLVPDKVPSGLKVKD